MEGGRRWRREACTVAAKMLYNALVASRQNVIKHTPAPAGRDIEGEGWEVREGGRRGREACTCPPKCYKMHTCTGQQRERGRD